MPLYEFTCDDNHQTEWFGSYDLRPVSVACKQCGRESRRSQGVSRHQGIAPSTMFDPIGNAKEYKGMSHHTFTCDQCKSEEDDVVDHGLGQSVDDERSCGECGGSLRWVPGNVINRESERYPYFDRGLGMQVDSKQHRANICANPRKYGINSDGLTPVDGDWDPDKEMAEYRKGEEDMAKGYAEYEDKLENHPAFSSYRKARDQGRV